VLVRIETSEQMSEIAGKRLVVVVLQRHAVYFLPNVKISHAGGEARIRGWAWQGV
jgi:hypothetical protein